MNSLQDIAERTGIKNLPSSVFHLWKKNKDKTFENMKKPIVDEGFLRERLKDGGVPQDEIEKLVDLVRRIEENQDLKLITHFMILETISKPCRDDVDIESPVVPEILGEHKENYPFVFLLCCLAPRLDQLKERGIPEEICKDVARKAVANIAGIFERTGRWMIDDFQWFLNFFNGFIFHFNRLLFMPIITEGNFTMFRNKKTGEKRALFNGGFKFRADGQLDGTNDIFADEDYFISELKETDEAYIGNFVNPLGFVRKDLMTLRKEEWEPVYGNGDWMISIHMPSGPGYNIENFRDSMLQARQFFSRYYPECDIKGFWCESWLFDSRLQLIISEERSNIVKIQRQVYIFPMRTSDRMLLRELFGTADRKNLPRDNSLRKGAAEYMDRGGRFNHLGMVLLDEDMDKFGSKPYFTDEYYKEFLETVDIL
jgi:hypothetical protein